MDIRYIVRPRMPYGTPARLAEVLEGSKVRKWPNNYYKFTPSLKHDFLFKMPAPQDIQEAGDYECLQTANLVHTFFTSSKAAQRGSIGITLPVPWTSTLQNTWNGTSSKFVVRPLRHSRSQHYRITENPNDFKPGSEYISELFLKDREYRIIYIYGSPVVVLRKRVADTVSAEEPWGYENSTFRTINDIPGSYIASCGAIEAIGKHPVVRAAHIVGADVMWRKDGKWAVLEFNSAPAITIDANVKKIAEHIKNYQPVNASGDH